MDRKEKIIFLQRENRKRRIIDEYIKNLSKALDYVVSKDDILSLTESDTIQTELFTEESKDKITIQVPKDESERLDAFIFELVKFLSDKNYLLKTYHSEDIGFVLIRTSNILLKWREIIKFDGDEFMFFNPSLKDGIQIELTEDFILGKEVYGRIWLYEVNIYGKTLIDFTTTTIIYL